MAKGGLEGAFGSLGGWIESFNGRKKNSGADRRSLADRPGRQKRPKWGAGGAAGPAQLWADLTRVGGRDGDQEPLFPSIHFLLRSVHQNLRRLFHRASEPVSTDQVPHGFLHIFNRFVLDLEAIHTNSGLFNPSLYLTPSPDLLVLSRALVGTGQGLVRTPRGRVGRCQHRVCQGSYCKLM